MNIDASTKVIVTGGSGFLGRHVVKAFRARGCEPIVPRSAEVDLCHWEPTLALMERVRPDLVVHGAWTGGGIVFMRAHPGTIARDNTPELDALKSAASELDASVTLMTPDGRDIDELVRRTAKAPVMISADDAGNRWAEDGWWLTPLIALLLLTRFRKEGHLKPAEAAAAS